MKFKNLNEAVNAERFAKNVRERTILAIKDFELQNFAEQEGSSKALEDIYRHIGYALDGRENIVDALFSIIGLKEDIEGKLKFFKDEFKHDSAEGYYKTIDVFLGGITRRDLLKLKYS